MQMLRATLRLDAAAVKRVLKWKRCKRKVSAPSPAAAHDVNSTSFPSQQPKSTSASPWTSKLLPDEEATYRNLGMGAHVCPAAPAIGGLFRQHWQDVVVTEIPSLTHGAISHEENFALPSVESVFGADGAYFLQCNMRKENLSSGAALSLIRKTLNISRKDVSIASAKEPAADTFQQIRLRGVAAQSALAVNVASREKFTDGESNVTLSNFSFRNDPLKGGDLFGDHYKIVLRDVNAAPAEIEVAIQRLRELGFPNYFCQRFDWFGGKEDASLAVLHGDFVRFAFLLLDYSPARHTMRELLQRRKMYPRAIQNMFRKEAILLLRQRGIEPVALDRVNMMSAPEIGEYADSSHEEQEPTRALVRTTLEMAFHNLHWSERRSLCQAFSRYCWNQVLTLRAEKFGLHKPIEGDIVIPEAATANCSSLSSLAATDAMDVATMKNITDLTIFDVVHPHFSLNDGFLPANHVASIYQDICCKYGISWSSMIADERGITDFTGPPRRIVLRPIDLRFQYDHDKHILVLDFDLPATSSASALILELMKLSSCAELDEIVRPNTVEASWDLGRDDPAYVPTFSDHYVVQQYGDEYDNTTVTDPVANVDLYSKDCEDLFLPESEDPVEIARAWGKKYLLKNSKRIQKQQLELRKLLFEDGVDEQVSEEDLDNYVSHPIPLPPNANKKRIKRLVNKSQRRHSKGVPHVQPTICIGESVRVKKLPPYVTLHKDSWNRLY